MPRRPRYVEFAGKPSAQPKVVQRSAVRYRERGLSSTTASARSHALRHFSAEVDSPGLALVAPLPKSTAASSVGFTPATSLASSRASRKVVKSSRVTLDTIRSLYTSRTPITMFTAYDFPTARMLAMASSTRSASPQHTSPSSRGIDICLCGDSLAMVALGYISTTSISFPEFLFHAQAVRRGLDSVFKPPYGYPSTSSFTYRLPFLVIDLPFGSFEPSIAHGVNTATTLVREARADAVKIEGGAEVVPLVRKLTSHGIAVMGHVGLRPQRHTSLGGYKIQGEDEASALAVFDDAVALEDAGAFAVVLEAVPLRVASYVTSRLSIPTIGIGAGAGVSGQVLVAIDALGGLDGRQPRFVEKFLDGFELGTQAIGEYAAQVRGGSFPKQRHGYEMSDEVWEKLRAKGWK